MSNLLVSGTLLVDPGGANEAAGPTGTYSWDSTTNHSGGLEALGYLQGQKVYKSDTTHPDGLGGTCYWYRFKRNGEWLIAKSSTYGHIRLTGATGCTSVTPRFDFTSGTVNAYVNGSTTAISFTSGVEKTGGSAIALTVGQTIDYVASNWNALTRIDIRDDKVSGDISGWVLPSGLVNFAVHITSVSGDISGWVLPSGLVYFQMYNTSVSGNISGWVLPSSLVTFYVNTTSVSGDISGWVLPSSLVNFYVYNTSVSGNISGWVLPSTITTCMLYSTALDYDATSGMFTTWPTGLTKIDFDNCNLTQSQVDKVLADCVTSGKSTKQLDVGDNNAAPSAAGLASKATLETAGWTVKVTA